MKLICDSRERQGTLYLFPKGPVTRGDRTVEILERTLTVGDYSIVNVDEVVWLLERKTWADLSASIKDGRLDKQSREMATMTCRTGFIIEGPLTHHRDTLIGGIPFYKLDAMRNRLMAEGFFIVQTATPTHTVEWLLDFTFQVCKITVKDPKVGAGDDKSVSVACLTERRTYTAADHVRNIWAQFPHVGPTMVEALMHYSMTTISMMGPTMLGGIRGTTGRRLGDRAAQRILDVFGAPAGDMRAADVVAEFPGLSKTSARYILRTISFRQFITEDMTTIKKSDTATIGPKCAAMIRELVSFLLS